VARQKPKAETRCRGNSWFVPYDTIANRERHRGSHPATFPVALIEQCINFSGIKSGVLVDPFMGSGTSALAAVNCSIDYIGFDIDQDYINFAQDRIQEHKSNTVVLKSEVDK
jgi:site-specific DNA-methyltransferase (adenine-specific)